MRARLAVPIALLFVSVGLWGWLNPDAVSSWFDNVIVQEDDDATIVGLQSEEEWLIVIVDFAENPEVVFKYAKENRSPGPAKDYKNQDLNSSGSVWGWVPAYASRFPNHENIKRIKSWEKEKMNKYQRLMYSALDGVGTHYVDFAASWNVGAEPNCHFIK